MRILPLLAGIFFLSLNAQNVPFYMPANGLEAYYPMDSLAQVNGNLTVLDATANQRHGIFMVVLRSHWIKTAFPMKLCIWMEWMIGALFHPLTFRPATPSHFG